MTIAATTRVEELQAAALRIRHHILDMGEAQGQGYVGQGLGVSDVLAVVYKDLATLRPEDPHWDGRDRVLLSIGHGGFSQAVSVIRAATGAVDLRRHVLRGGDGRWSRTRFFVQP